MRSLGAASASAGTSLLATAAGACCVPIVAPLIVAALGASGAAWVAGLKPYSPYFLLVSGVLLGYGYWGVYAQRAPCDDGRCATFPSLGRRILLWAATAIWAAALALNLLPLLAALLARLSS